MNIIHIGAEKCVTGSCHLLQVKGLNIMVDCGLSQGHDVSAPMDSWPVRPDQLDFLFLTHAHIDHIGGFVVLDGEKVEIKARIHVLTGYSAHADQNGLVEWVQAMPQKPAAIKLVHGETHARRALARVLREKGYEVS